MNVTIRRGFGLLVIAAAALLVFLMGENLMGNYVGAGRVAFALVVGIGFIGGLFGGLALLAYGLIRKPR